MAMTPGVQSIGVEEGTTQNTRSVLELDDLSDFIDQAEMANREFASERERYEPYMTTTLACSAVTCVLLACMLYIP